MVTVPSSLGHSSREIDNIFERATWIPATIQKASPTLLPCDRTPVVVTYHPTFEPIRRIIKQLQPILNKDQTLR